MTTGRFAPSPTADLHVGNLRTALLAWLFARSGTPPARFVMRVEDLDPGARRPEVAARQLADLAALGLDWDGEVVLQSDRLDRHHAAIDRLVAAGLAYECWCSRAEVAAATVAPNTPGLPGGAYPGTCANLDDDARARRAATTARPPALRLRAGGATESFVDLVAGPVHGVVDDFVIRRSDGLPAYNLAVVVDDADAGVDQVVRGDDLVASTPRQLLVGRLLGLDAPEYAHVGLVVGPDGGRMAKRGASTTLGELAAAGVGPGKVLGRLAASVGLCRHGEPVTAQQLLNRFDPAALSLGTWHTDPASWGA